jgi:putative membrane protein
MDPDWATLDRAWIWRDGGPWFGVPVSNYLGWFLTTFVFYLLFALWFRNRVLWPAPQPRSFWRSAVALYAVCALGNLLIPIQPMAPSIVADPTGKLWQTSHVLLACVLCSVFVMFPLAVIAWFRIPLAGDSDSRS